MFIQEMVEQAQAKLEEAQVTAISAVNDLDPIISFGNHTQEDDPDVGQASSDQQTSQACRSEMWLLCKLNPRLFWSEKKVSIRYRLAYQ